MPDNDQILFILNRMETKLDSAVNMVTRNDETLNNPKTGLVTIVSGHEDQLQEIKTENRVRKAKVITGMAFMSIFGGVTGHFAAEHPKVAEILEKAKGLFE